jgi:hypothetical protein
MDFVDWQREARVGVPVDRVTIVDGLEMPSVQRSAGLQLIVAQDGDFQIAVRARNASDK